MVPRPKKTGLDYFPLDVDFLDDPKIKILKARYGRDGIVFYIYLLCEIYKQGYYLQVDNDFEYIVSDDLKIDQNKAKQVLNFLLSRSLFDNTLFQSDKVLTSAGIQKRFQLAVKERARKNPIEVGRYWLLKEEETEPFIKCTHFGGLSKNNKSFSRNNDCNSAEKSLKKSKVNNIYNIKQFSPELEQSFQTYLLVRKHNFGELIPEQENALREELQKIADNDAERLAIVKKATVSGWKSFYKTTTKKTDAPRKKSKPPVKDMNNFKRRKYDMDSLENQLLDN